MKKIFDKPQKNKRQIKIIIEGLIYNSSSTFK